MPLSSQILTSVEALVMFQVQVAVVPAVLPDLETPEPVQVADPLAASPGYPGLTMQLLLRETAAPEQGSTTAETECLEAREREKDLSKTMIMMNVNECPLFIGQ